MSAATDGFSAMTSFFPMRRERPQMISANAEAVQPRCAGENPRTRERAHARARVRALVGEPHVRRAEEIFGDEAAGGHLLVPEHHQHYELELIEREAVSGGGERALDHQLARLRIENARLLEREEKAAAFGVELCQLTRREGAESRARVRQLLRHPVRRAQHPRQPVQRFADVRVVKASRRELLRDALAVVGQFGLLAVLEQVDKDVVHYGLPPNNAPLGLCVYSRFPFSRRWNNPPGSAVTRPSSSSRSNSDDTCSADMPARAHSESTSTGSCPMCASRPVESSALLVLESTVDA